MSDNRKRFTVLWRAQRQDKRSAPMTDVEAQKFADKLRGEKVDSLEIQEVPAAPMRMRA
jgi:hypothetical protein